LVDNEGNQIRKHATLANGKFYFNLKCGIPYTIQVTKNGFFDGELQFKTSQVNGYINEETIYIEEKEFKMRKTQEMLSVESIKFELNSTDIKKESERILEKVIRLMKKYPKMKIEFGVHTDSRGPDAFNLSLTKRRAEATAEYLISKGADFMRLTSRGYGETIPLNKCVNGVKCTDLQYQLNKRTEFVVLKR